MIWKVLLASAAFFIIWTAFFAYTPGISAVDTSLINQYGNRGIGGFTVGQMVGQSFTLYMAGNVIVVIFLIIYLMAAAVSEEEDSGVLFAFNMRPQYVPDFPLLIQVTWQSIFRKKRHAIVWELMVLLVIIFVFGIIWAVLYYGGMLPEANFVQSVYTYNIFQQDSLTFFITVGAFWPFIVLIAVLAWLWNRSNKRDLTY